MERPGQRRLIGLTDDDDPYGVEALRQVGRSLEREPAVGVGGRLDVDQRAGVHASAAGAGRQVEDAVMQGIELDHDAKASQRAGERRGDLADEVRPVDIGVLITGDARIVLRSEAQGENLGCRERGAPDLAERVVVVGLLGGRLGVAGGEDAVELAVELVADEVSDRVLDDQAIGIGGQIRLRDLAEVEDRLVGPAVVVDDDGDQDVRRIVEDARGAGAGQEDVGAVDRGRVHRLAERDRDRSGDERGGGHARGDRVGEGEAAGEGGERLAVGGGDRAISEACRRRCRWPSCRQRG